MEGKREARTGRRACRIFKFLGFSFESRCCLECFKSSGWVYSRYMCNSHTKLQLQKLHLSKQRLELNLGTVIAIFVKHIRRNLQRRKCTVKPKGSSIIITFKEPEFTSQITGRRMPGLRATRSGGSNSRGPPLKPLTMFAVKPEGAATR